MKVAFVQGMASTSDGEMVFPNLLSSMSPPSRFTLLSFNHLYRGIGHSKPGQRIVNPGVVILGYPGDPVYDDKDAVARPDFTKDGSFMVFRKLEQNVLFLEDYVNKNWRSIPADEAKDGTSLTDEQRKKLFAARMVGRFKSVSYAE